MPKPQTLTLNPKPQTLNPKPQGESGERGERGEGREATWRRLGGDLRVGGRPPTRQVASIRRLLVYYALREGGLDGLREGGEA